MIREIVLDTETTGLSPKSGDKIVEIGCVELINHIPSGKHYHIYLNPERDMPEEAFRIHGISSEFLADKPIFYSEYQKFMEFIANSTLIIHNAPFDLGFLNAELKNCSQKPITNKIIDTVQLARKIHPGARVSLDALCKHYNISNAHRKLHGALLDSEILAEVYLELIGGRQVGLALNSKARSENSNLNSNDQTSNKAGLEIKIIEKRLKLLQPRVSEQEKKSHDEMVKKMGRTAVWQKYN